MKNSCNLLFLSEFILLLCWPENHYELNLCLNYCTFEKTRKRFRQLSLKNMCRVHISDLVCFMLDLTVNSRCSFTVSAPTNMSSCCTWADMFVMSDPSDTPFTELCNQKFELTQIYYIANKRHQQVIERHYLTCISDLRCTRLVYGSICYSSAH